MGIVTKYNVYLKKEVEFIVYDKFCGGYSARYEVIEELVSSYDGNLFTNEVDVAAAFIICNKYYEKGKKYVVRKEVEIEFGY